jgi:protein-tyrosine phosphatase
MTDEVFSVLFVCHANVCRSPMAERLARLLVVQRFGEGAATVAFSSAGTHAYRGDPMSRHAARVLRDYGADDTGFSSRRVDRDLLADADLVLTTTREQRAYCAGVAPAAVRRTFTLRQLARLIGAMPPDGLPTTSSVGPRLRALVAQTASVRARFQFVRAPEDDLGDPVNQPVDAFRACARDIWAALDVIAGPPVRDPATADRSG